MFFFFFFFFFFCIILWVINLTFLGPVFVIFMVFLSRFLMTYLFLRPFHFSSSAKFFLRLFTFLLKNYLFFLCPTRWKYPVIKIRPGHWPMVRQKHRMTDSKFLQSIIQIANLVTQIKNFELNKSMDLLCQNQHSLPIV